MSFSQWAAVTALLVLAAGPALASDGRLEIHQACVTAGCFPGDGPGLPVQVPAGASAVMTSNLALPDANASAISLGAGASLDMNGFAVEGVTNCSGVPATCTGFGAGYGITMGVRASLRNGTVRRAGSHGVYANEGSVVENVTMSENGGSGYTASGKGQQILGCRILQNRQRGISLYYGSSYGAMIRGNTIYGNGEQGVQVVGAQLLDNVITHNADEGAYMADGTAFGGNKFAENNGGNANAQINSGVAVGGNVCGNVACP